MKLSLLATFSLILLLISCKTAHSSDNAYKLKSESKTEFIPILANIDDDDMDGRADSEDHKINGEHDILDLTPVSIEKEYRFKVSNFQNSAINVFYKNSDGSISSEDTKFSARKTILIEAVRLADKNQPRNFTVDLDLKTENGGTETYPLNLSIAPFVMLPNSAKTETFYIATGAYNTTKMISQISNILNKKGVKLHKPYLSYDWQDMWMQDSVEIGYAQLPGKEPMYIVMNGIRGYDGFGPTLFGRDMAVIKVGSVRNLGGGDDWADWFGNLEVTAPTAKYPLGRIYYGLNSSSKIALHPEVVSFLKAQNVQDPFPVETGYLTIKHVDEIFNFVRSASGEDYLIIGGTQLALDMRLEFSELFKSSETGKHFSLSGDREYNLRIQRILNSIKEDVISKTGWDRSKIIELPVLYHQGHNIWSNPINSVYINGTIITGETYLPPAVRADITSKFRSIGLDTVYVTDKVYQDRYGNIHCSSNTKKIPLVSDYSNLVY